MVLFYFSIVLAVAASILYHVVLKVTPSQVNPAISLVVTYGLSMALSLCLLPLFPLKTNIVEAFKELNWASYALAFSLVGLEAGYLLAYRAGWRVSVAAIFVNATMTVLLIPIGLSFFKEKLSPLNAVGILVCLAGLVMMNWKN
jgi:multidrug transporter EmrE-like cation transporter